MKSASTRPSSIEEWARTLKIKPDHADAAIARARALAEDGDPGEALAVLDAFGARFARGGAGAAREVSVARGEIVAARNITFDAAAGEKSERAEPSEARAPSSTSVLAGGSRSGVSASKAGALRPLSIARENYTLLRRARAARESERNEESVALYRRVIEGSGGYFPPANLELGFALARLGRNEEAVASIRRVTDKEGERYPIAFYHLGRYYEHLGRLAEAGAAYARASALLGAESPQFLLDVSRVREKEGKWAEALAATEDYVRAVEPLGATPDWARERLERLRQKAATATGEQK
ncbi:MAG: tetratricopeptide repeat protein [Acidobacteria bacterium]|nr:tetratricopeptide repeat protein [Acidobacteriota bacterium]